MHFCNKYTVGTVGILSLLPRLFKVKHLQLGTWLLLLGYLYLKIFTPNNNSMRQFSKVYSENISGSIRNGLTKIV